MTDIKQRNGHTDKRHTDKRQTDIQTLRQTDRQRSKHTGRDIERKQMNILVKLNRQIDRKIHFKRGSTFSTHRHIGKLNRHKDIQTDKLTKPNILENTTTI